MVVGPPLSPKALGIPIPVCMHLQHGGFTFRKAMWTAKQSASGFSIHFFWPEPHQGEKSNSSRPKCKTKKRKNNKKREVLKSLENQDTTPSKMLEVQKPVVIEEPSPPNDAYQVQSASGTGENVKSPEEKHRKIDQANCKEVAYEMRDGMPGVRYKEETEYEDQGWASVIRKRKLRRKLVGNLSDKSGESSDEELKLTRGTRSVKYKIVNGMPGLRIKRRTLWLVSVGLPLHLLQ